MPSARGEVTRKGALALVIAAVSACTSGAAPSSGESAFVMPRTRSAARAMPPVLLLDVAALNRARDGARADRDVPGLAELRREADSAAKAKPMTVTDKKTLAPSGDPHDYMSLSIYWWPDPTKPTGLPYVQKDGQVNPESSDATRYDAPKLSRMVGSVEALSLAAYVTGDRGYADAAARWLRTWFLDPATRMTPSMRYAQIIPGRTEVRGTGIIDSRQVTRAVDAALLLEGTPSWSSADADGLRAWCGDLAEWLISSENGRLERAAKNNHGIWYDAQLADLALYAGRTQIAKDALLRVIDERVPAQFAADGTQPLEVARTRSYHYSAFNLLAVAVAADLGPSVGVDVWHGAAAPRIRAAIDLLVRYSDASAKWPYPDIEKIDAFKELAPILARATHAYPDAGYDATLARLSVGASSEALLRLQVGAFGALGGTAAAPALLAAAR